MIRKKPGRGRPVLPSASSEALGQVPGGSGLGVNAEDHGSSRRSWFRTTGKGYCFSTSPRSLCSACRGVYFHGASLIVAFRHSFSVPVIRRVGTHVIYCFGGPRTPSSFISIAIAATLPVQRDRQQARLARLRYNAVYKEFALLPPF